MFGARQPFFYSRAGGWIVLPGRSARLAVRIERHTSALADGLGRFACETIVRHCERDGRLARGSLALLSCANAWPNYNETVKERAF